MLILGTEALGQFQTSFEMGGSINSFQADSQNDMIPDANLHNKDIHSL